jgi:hypothetical protein
MLTPIQIEVLKNCISLEEKMVELYSEFHDQFPEHTIWKTLIKEEKLHAMALAELREMALQDKAVFTEGGVTPERVQKLIDYVDLFESFARVKKYNIQEALSVAIDLEKTIFESQMHKHFKVSQEYQHMLNIFNDDTDQHMDLLRNELAKSK